jgi:outer membrane protein OmpA-like peptidoglycan-associated protein
LKGKRLAILSAGLVALLGQPFAAGAAEVDGYIRSSNGSVVTSSSGDCVRTTFRDSTEYPQECGYERVVETAAEVESGASGTDVTIVESAGVVKGDEVIAVTDVAITEVTVNNVEFAFDSAELSPAYKAELDTASEFLRPHRSLLRQGLAHLDVVGYTDSRGNDAYNQKLSERRAQAVADYLVEQDPSRASFIRVIGRGEADPIASNATEAGRRQNRRVVLEVVPK